MTIPARLQAYLRENAREQLEAVPLPLFTLFIHPTDASSGASYAIPDEPAAEDWLQPVDELRATFKERGPAPFVQYIEEYAPRLAPALRARGFEEVWRTQLMACTPETLRPPPEQPGLTFVMSSSHSPLAEVREGWDVNARGFDPNALPGTDEEVEAFRRTLVTSRAFTVRLEGEAVGAGMFTEIRQGVTELVGVTTLNPFRRRGVASALTAHMTRRAFEHGVNLVFLGAANEAAGRVYERAGFSTVGSLVGYRANS